jgi:hypothetical protein
LASDQFTFQRTHEGHLVPRVERTLRQRHGPENMANAQRGPAVAVDEDAHTWPFVAP